MGEVNRAAYSLIAHANDECMDEQCSQFRDFLDATSNKVICPNPVGRFVSEGILWLFLGVCLTLVVTLLVLYNTKKGQVHSRSCGKSNSAGYQRGGDCDLPDDLDQKPSFVPPEDTNSGAFFLATTTMTVGLLSSREQSPIVSRQDSFRQHSHCESDTARLLKSPTNSDRDTDAENRSL